MQRALVLLLVASLASAAAADEQREIAQCLVRISIPNFKIGPLDKLNTLLIGEREQITEKDLVLVAKLPALRHLTVYPPLPDTGWQQLLKCKNLRTLSINGASFAVLQSKLSTNQLREISAITQLESLVFENVEVTEEGMLELSKLDQLRNLHFSPPTKPAITGIAKADKLFCTWYCKVHNTVAPSSSAEVRNLSCDDVFTTEALAACRFPKLQKVSLPRVATNEMLKSLELWPELEELTINSIHVTDLGVAAICQASKLRKLDLRETAITGRALTELSKLKYLQELVPPRADLESFQSLHEAKLLHLLVHKGEMLPLQMTGRAVRDDSLALVRDLSQIESLDLSGSSVTDAGFKHLSSLKNLQELTLISMHRLRGLEFQQLAQLPKRRCISLNYSEIDDRAGEGLGQLTSLQELDLRITKVTEKIVPQLPLKSLTHLRLPHKAVTDATCELLAKHGKLHTLDLFWLSLPNGQLGKVAADDKHIQRFNLSGTATTEKTLQLFLNLPILSLEPAVGLTDEGMITIGKLSELEYLTLEKQTGITDAGCKHLANLKKLKGISFTNTRITDAGVEHLREATELTSLSLDNTPITDASLRVAEGLPKLKWLNVHGTKVTPAGLRQFHKTNPQCSIAAQFGWRQ